MDKEKTRKIPRKPTSVESYIAVLLVFGGVVICIAIGLPVQAALVFGAVIAFLFALYLGYGWQDVEEAISLRMGKVTPTMLTLLMIGFFIGAILFSGTLPILVVYGFRLMSPKHMYLSALIVCSIISLATGSSWTSASTVGVVCMLLCKVCGGREAMMAGAVISGAIFGDKISPMSDTTNLAPACTGDTLWEHIHAQLYTTVPAYIISMVFYSILDLSNSGGIVPEYANEIIGQLGELYNLSPVLLLPIVVLLILCLLRKPVVPCFLISGILALVLGALVQGGPFTIVLGGTVAVSGFTVDMIAPEGMQIFYEIEYLLNRGGMTSMVNNIILCYAGFSLTTILTHTGIMNKAVEPLMNFANTRVKAVVSAEIADFAILAMSGISYMSSTFVGQAWRRAYIKNDCGLPALSRTLEDVGTTCAILVPWSQSNIIFVGALGVAAYGAGSYIPFVSMTWLCPVIAIILAVTGIGMFKLTPEQKAAELTKLDAEEGTVPDLEEV